MYKLVVIRHGESLWNQENRFTGWKDVDLSSKGLNEAVRAGRLLSRAGFNFDEAYTSVLKRAIKTLHFILDEMDLLWIPVIKDWRLNERHYGALQGLNKSETAALHGEEQVKIWRRSYSTPPPMMELSDSRHPRFDKKYKNIDPQVLPSGESLNETVQRFMPLWNNEIAPKVKSGKKIFIAAHGNSLRALIQHLEGLTPEQIMEVNVPTGIPLLYELSTDLKVIKKEYLGDPEEIKDAMDHVASQGKKK